MSHAAGPMAGDRRPAVRILGCRGIPAAHGGFETFAEALALHLVERGWRVVVYGQEVGTGPPVRDCWRGVERVRIPVAGRGPAATVVFDWRATRDAARHRDPCLTLGYNTALFGALLRWRAVPQVVNMDGIEWARAKWGPAARLWFRLNDWAACGLADHLVADHPEIGRLLARRVRASKIAQIPYGAERLHEVDEAPVRALGLTPGRYLTLIARPEPENSILEIVGAFSRRPRGVELAVLGALGDTHAYHRAVRAAAGPEVRLLGALYDRPTVQALRAHCLAYLHGHRVGGTNPSLVEALGAGNAVVAQDNRFNRWVAGPQAAYFIGADDLSNVLDALLTDERRLAHMRAASRQRFEEAFTWPAVLAAYEQLLARLQPRPA